jgi:hypothetical protein
VDIVRCAFLDMMLHSRMLLVPIETNTRVINSIPLGYHLPLTVRRHQLHRNTAGTATTTMACSWMQRLR